MQNTTSLPKHIAVESNPYLLLREEKIARNQNRLAKLGLANNKSSGSSNSSAKHVVIVKTASLSAPTTTGLVMGTRRRSSRLRISSGGVGVGDGDGVGVGNGDCNDAGGISTRTSHGIESRGGRRSTELQSTKTTTTRKRGRELPSSSQLIQQLEPGFTRSTTIDVHTVLFGRPLATHQNSDDTISKKHIHHNCRHHGGMIGQRLKTTGKAIVVNSSARLSNDLFSNNNNNNNEGHPSSSDGTELRFNKYSGICEWKNDVIFLWVNIGAPGSDVVNEFLQGGKQITWFGGSRMHQYTPAIQNLLRIGKMVSSSNHPDPSAPRADSINNKSCSSGVGGGSGIILWCRMYDRTKRTFLPYTCLGRVGYRSHDPDVHPIQFIWDLLDYEVLMKGGAVVKGGKDGVDSLGGAVVKGVEDDVDSLGGRNAFEQIMVQANE